MSCKKDFDYMLLRAIDEALSALGESSRAAIYISLEEKYSLKRQDIPQRIGDFSDALDKIFGLAARNLEIIFMKKLHNEIKCLNLGIVIEPIRNDFTFQKYVDILRHSFDEMIDEEADTELEFLVNEGEKKEQSR